MKIAFAVASIALLVAVALSALYITTPGPRVYDWQTGRTTQERFTLTGFDVYSPFQDAGYLHAVCHIPALSTYTVYDPDSLVAVGGRVGWQVVSYGACVGYAE